MARYVIADPDLGTGWGHIFSENGIERERITRFVFNTDTGSLVHVDIQRAAGLIAANADEVADLEDSLKNANPEALESPESWGLMGSEMLPAWCSVPHPCKGMTKAETDAFERIATGISPQCSQGTIKRLMDAGLIERKTVSLAPTVDRFGTVVTYAYSVPFAILGEWCEYIARPRKRTRSQKRSEQISVYGLPLFERRGEPYSLPSGCVRSMVGSTV